jgi:hypothetical protein
VIGSCFVGPSIVVVDTEDSELSSSSVEEDEEKDVGGTNAAIVNVGRCLYCSLSDPICEVMLYCCPVKKVIFRFCRADKSEFGIVELQIFGTV